VDLLAPGGSRPEWIGAAAGRLAEERDPPMRARRRPQEDPIAEIIAPWRTCIDKLLDYKVVLEGLPRNKGTTPLGW